MAVIRWILGRIILVLDWLTMPRGVKRSAEAQSKVEQALAGLALYQYQACPFCVKVRRELKRKNLKLELRDAKQLDYKTELEQGGGRVKVPCLRIEETGQVQWLYESSDIIEYLNQRVASAA